MPDKMMRVAGRGDDGTAKPIKTNNDGVVGTYSTSDIVQVNDRHHIAVSNQDELPTVIDEFENGDAQYVQFGLAISTLIYKTKFVIESVIEGGEFGNASYTVFRMEETLDNGELPSEGVIFDTRSSSMKASPTSSNQRTILFTHKIPLFGHKTRLTMQIITDPVLSNVSYYYAVSRRMM